MTTTSFEFLFEKSSVLRSNDSPDLMAEVENIGGHQVTIFLVTDERYSKGAVRFVKGQWSSGMLELGSIQLIMFCGPDRGSSEEGQQSFVPQMIARCLFVIPVRVEAS